VSSRTETLGVKSEPQHLHKAHGTAHTFSAMETSSQVWYWLEIWIEDCNCREYQGLLCSSGAESLEGFTAQPLNLKFEDLNTTTSQK
jgi:hypothetical protein